METTEQLLQLLEEERAARKIAEEKVNTTQMRLEEVMSRAGNSLRAKELFLAKMSHEIRTPMNAILGMAGLMGNTLLNNKQKTYLDAIKISSKHLLTIINDILDVTKVEAGMLNLENIGFNLRHIIKDSVNAVYYMNASKNVSLTYNIDERIPAIIKGDPVRFKQIVLNLISNAIKFTVEGRVEVMLEWKGAEGNKHHIHCAVKDTGIGIEEEKLSLIFDTFTQGDESTTRKFGGTGLGLTITKQLVELMGGEIQVKSKKGEGSTFAFSLMCEEGSPADLPEVPVKSQDLDYRSLRGMRVLLAEDNQMNQFLATAILESWQMEVHIANDGEKAVQMLEKGAYDLILMDIQMPNMGGVEATEIIRKKMNIHTPIVALTANAIKGNREQYLQAGMNGYVSKPFDTESLFKQITSVLQLKYRALAKEEEIENLRNTPITHELTVSMLAEAHFSLNKLEKTAQGNLQFIKRMISIFCEQVPDQILQLKNAYEMRNWPELKRVAHQMKPSIDIMEVTQLKAEIRVIEKLSEKNPNRKELLQLISKTEQILTLVVNDLKQELQNIDTQVVAT